VDIAAMKVLFHLFWSWFDAEMQCTRVQYW